jgi:HK97 family phage major capsid protein
MTDERTTPTDDLYRAMQGGITSEDGRTLTIRLAPHDQWAEIESVTEGHFMERFSRSAYRKTMAEALPKILFQHGRDPVIGEKPIATTDDVGEDETSPYARGQLLDGLPELVTDGIRKGVYGASHRFSVVREKWDDKPLGGPHNPAKLPERTITEARLYELGPVTWPAYAQASASLRSMTDEMRPTPTPPVAPSDDAGPTPTSPERRDEPVTIAAPTPKEIRTVEYVTREEKASRVSELKDALARQAIEYPGVLPTEAQETWDANSAEVDALERDIAAWDSRQARLAAYALDPKKHIPGAFVAPAVNVIRRKSEADVYDVDAVMSDRGYTLDERSQALRDNAMRAVEIANFPISDKSRTQERIANLIDHSDRDDEIRSLILRTGSPIYRRAFPKALLGRAMTPEEQRAVGAVNVLATGGYAVPFQFDTSIIGIGAHTAVNPYRAACRVVTIAGTNTWEPLTATAMTAAFAAEAAAAIDSTPTFARPTFQVQTARAFSQVSMELLQDRPDLPAELGVLIGEAKDTLEETKFSLGAGVGSNEPLGMFITGTFTNVDSVANDAIDVGDPEKVEAALGLRHRANAAWFMARKTIRAYQALETTGGYANVQAPATDSPTGNTGLRLLGYPIWETPSAPTGTVDGTITAVFGDPNKYAIVDRLGLTVEYVPHLVSAAGNLPIGARGIFAYWRTMGGRIDVNGMASMSVQ